MSKPNFVTLAVSALLCTVLSVVVNIEMNRHREQPLSDVIKTRSLQLVDGSGNVRAVFELRQMLDTQSVPYLAMRDPEGREVVEMSLDRRGDGSLSFANDYWQEGAIILGHLGTVDDGTESKSRSIEDKSGAWGLRVRSRDGKFIGIGVANSGIPFAPTAATINAQK